MNETEINDYLSKCDEDLANNVMYRVYGMPGPIFMEKNTDTPPTPEPGPDYSIPFYVENITQEDETLTITGIRSEENGYLEIPVEYSTDGTNWTSFGTTGATPLTMTIQPGDKVYLRATTDTWNAPIFRRCEISGISKIGGNIMSLLYGSSFTGNETTFPSGSHINFGGLLTDEDNLISASELILPATTLTEGCYDNMFHGCTSLTTAPELPATTLADGCYLNMFYNCTSLTAAPAILPATTLDYDCYAGMFSGCTSLTINNIPQLPATTLADDCYADMFNSITMDEGEYRIWCSENIPEAANYDESIHGRLFGQDQILN